MQLVKQEISSQTICDVFKRYDERQTTNFWPKSTRAPSLSNKIPMKSVNNISQRLAYTTRVEVINRRFHPLSRRKLTIQNRYSKINHEIHKWKTKKRLPNCILRSFTKFQSSCPADFKREKIFFRRLEIYFVVVNITQTIHSQHQPNWKVKQKWSLN